jgi:hypothetical protein
MGRSVFQILVSLQIEEQFFQPVHLKGPQQFDELNYLRLNYFQPAY